MKTLLAAMAATAAAMVAGTSLAGGDASGIAVAQAAQQDLKGMEKAGQRDDTPQMTAAQAAQYRADYQAAKTRWAAMTPEQQRATIEAARNKKLKDLTMIELVGQRDDMQRETAAQSGALKAQADAAKAQWDKMTPQQKQATRKSAWAKKRAELSGIEQMGQRDDTEVLPWNAVSP
jgi:hypothetical protein